MDTTRKLIIGALGTVLLGATSSFAATPGQGWDAFGTAAINEGTGEAVMTIPGGYKGTSFSPGMMPGKGWDAFNAGHDQEVESIPEASKGYQGTSMQVPSRGYDAFGSGSPDL